MEQIQKTLREAQSHLKEGKTYHTKIAAIMLESTNVIGAGMDELGTQSVGYMNRPATDNAMLFDLFPKVFVSSPSLVLANETNPTGTVGTVAEGAIKPLIDSDFNAQAPTMTKYASTITIGDEMIGDINFMSDAVTNQLTRRLKDKIAIDFIKALATNAGVTSTNLTTGTGATAGVVMNVFPAIYADVLTKYGHDIDLFLLNSPDFAKAWIQSTDSNSFIEYYEKNLVPCSGVVAGSVMGIATQAQRVYILKDLTFEFGKNGDDFVKNQTTIRCEARIAWALGANNLSGVYFDTIASTITKIA
jgi:hypothetical protein